MIVVCEPICYGLEHVSINTAFLEIIRQAYPAEPLAVWAEATHLEYLRTCVPAEFESSITWVSITLPPRYARFFSRLKTEFTIIFHLFQTLARAQGRQVIFTSITPSMLYILKLFLSLVNHNLVAQIVMHGGLSSLMEWRSRNPFLRLTDFQSALMQGSNARIQYIILGNAIKKKLVALLPALHPHVAVLEHPIPSEEQAEHTPALSRPVRFGFLGLVAPYKGIDTFLKIASQSKTAFPGEVEFHVVGFVVDNHIGPEMSVLDAKPHTRQLERKAYIERLHAIHFACFPYQQQHYTLSPSGALLDAVVFEKPILAARLPIFEDLFYQYGDIGYLFDNEAELCKTVQYIVQEHDECRYQRQVQNLNRAREARRPAALIPPYRIMCERLLQTTTPKGTSSS